MSLFTQKQGLSSNNIHKILQDKFNFLWLATQDGLDKFDGNEFTIYNKGLQRKRRLYSTDIRDLVLDQDGNTLWIICNQGGINGIDIYTGDVKYEIPYQNINLEVDWRICAVMVNKKIYIGTSGGLEVFNTTTLTFEAAKKTNSYSPDLSQANDIRTINKDQNGNLWLGIFNKGIIIFNPTNQKMIKALTLGMFKENEEENAFWPLSGCFSEDSSYWLSTKKGLYKLTYDRYYNTSSVSLKEGPIKHLIKEEINCLMISSKKYLIIPCASLYMHDMQKNSVAKLHPVNPELFTGLKNISTCFEDNQHNMWVGGKQGLCIIKNTDLLFSPVRNSELFKNKLGHVLAVCPITNEKALIGTQEGLLLNNTNGIISLLDPGAVQNIFRLTSVDIVISGNNEISLFSANKIIPIEFKYPEFKNYKNWQLNSIGTINDSIAIIGTESNDGILLWNKRNHLIENIRQMKKSGSSALASNIVNSVFVNQKKQAVILSDYVLSIYDPNNKQIKNVVLKDSSSKKPLGIFMEMTETNSHYWINGYGEGLLKLDKNFSLLKKYGLAEGISNIGVYKIFNYKDSLLFLTSNKGISVFNLATEKFNNYFVEDGLQNNEFEEASGDTLNGILYAGGVNGYVKIDPTAFKSVITLPTLYFTKLSIQKPNNNASDTANLNASYFRISNDVLQTTIYFTGLNYNNPGRVTYQYNIKEIKNEWINLESQNFVSFIGISPGTYHLQVKAANEDGIWSDPKELVLEFLPKWYQTWGFKLLMVTIAGCIIYALYRYRIAQIKKEHEIRKNIATDLHDDLGSTLNSVKVFTNLAIGGINQNESLQHIKNNLNEATMGLRDMIWVLDDSLDTVEELITRLKQFTIPLAAATNIKTSIKADSGLSSHKLSKEEKRNLFLACKEAVNNSIKYSGASRIDLSILPAGKKIKIIVTDNGKGFDVETVKKGYGLKNMQYRAAQIRYRVEVTSAPANGTQISLVPL